MKLNYYDNAWPLTLTNCPCDLDFVHYLESKQVAGKLIFHFGTGLHHLVGKNNYERGNPNEILAITASSDEHQAYVDFIVNNPAAANYYKVLFADIYTLSARMLPRFDIVSLFHLCEYYDQQRYDQKPLAGHPTRTGEEAVEPEARLNSAYARLNDVKLIELFLSRLNSGGKLLFFTKSGAYLHQDRKAAKLVNEFIYRKRMVVEEEYESLLICGRPW